MGLRLKAQKESLESLSYSLEFLLFSISQDSIEVGLRLKAQKESLESLSCSLEFLLFSISQDSIEVGLRLKRSKGVSCISFACLPGSQCEPGEAIDLRS